MRQIARAFAAALLLAAAVGAARWLLLPPVVAVVQPVHGPAVQAVYATGTVEPTVMVPISAHSIARLVELDVDEGDAVAKGQVLARLEDDDLRKSVELLEAEERYARAEYQRQADLVRRQDVSRTNYDRAKADWEKAKAAVEQATALAGYLKLVAPADGRIIRRDGEIGQLLPANETVFWMSCCAPLRISAEVDEEDIGLVRLEQKVLIRTDDFPGRVFDGTVREITPKGDPVARTFRVRVALPQDTPLMVGMTAETNIILRETDDALLVPAAAVIQDQVWLVRDGHLVRRPVRVGAKAADRVEIVDGLSGSDLIVAAPGPTLKEGQEVRPRPES